MSESRSLRCRWCSTQAKHYRNMGRYKHCIYTFCSWFIFITSTQYYTSEKYFILVRNASWDLLKFATSASSTAYFFEPRLHYSGTSTVSYIFTIASARQEIVTSVLASNDLIKDSDQGWEEWPDCIRKCSWYSALHLTPRLAGMLLEHIHWRRCFCRLSRGVVLRSWTQRRPLRRENMFLRYPAILTTRIA